MTRRLLATAVLAAALCLPAAATAVVPPKNCGMMTVKGKRYQIKADQISCNSGREHAKRFLERGRKPSGYRCTDQPSRKDQVDFYCNDGKKIFLGIRR